MRLWSEKDVLALMEEHSDRTGDKPETTLADMIADEDVHPIDIPDVLVEGMSESFQAYLATGELSPEHRAQIENDAISEAIRDVAKSMPEPLSEFEGFGPI